MHELHHQNCPKTCVDQAESTQHCLVSTNLSFLFFSTVHSSTHSICFLCIYSNRYQHRNRISTKCQSESTQHLFRPIRIYLTLVSTNQNLPNTCLNQSESTQHLSQPIRIHPTSSQTIRIQTLVSTNQNLPNTCFNQSESTQPCFNQ